MGHASFVTSVMFNRSNTLLTLGGNDHTVQQWMLVAEDSGYVSQSVPSAMGKAKAKPWAHLSKMQEEIDAVAASRLDSQAPHAQEAAEARAALAMLGHIPRPPSRG